MYVATIFYDSPRLYDCRALLSKQRLAWEEDCLNDWDKPTVRITCADTKTKLKPSRQLKKASKPQAKDDYQSETLPEGGYVWHTRNGAVRASFPYDAKLNDKIRRETQARINRRLTGAFTDSHGKSTDFEQIFKEDAA